MFGFIIGISLNGMQNRGNFSQTFLIKIIIKLKCNINILNKVNTIFTK